MSVDFERMAPAVQRCTHPPEQGARTVEAGRTTGNGARTGRARDPFRYELKDFSQQRIKELTSINQSLSALANVVGALKDGKKHVPYRASKLTRLLQDSLGGACRAAFVATMSPAHASAEETVSTLHFARRAMRVRTFAAGAGTHPSRCLVARSGRCF